MCGKNKLIKSDLNAFSKVKIGGIRKGIGID